MTIGAVLVVSGLLLVYGAVTNQSPTDAIRFVLSGGPDRATPHPEAVAAAARGTDALPAEGAAAVRDYVTLGPANSIARGVLP